MSTLLENLQGVMREGVMSSIHQMAQEASSAQDFINKFNSEYGDTLWADPSDTSQRGIIEKDVDEWLADLYTDAKSMKESKLNENRGQDEATDLIAKLRRTLYPKLSDLELDAFKNEMGQHFGFDMPMKESVNKKSVHELVSNTITSKTAKIMLAEIADAFNVKDIPRKYSKSATIMVGYIRKRIKENKKLRRSDLIDFNESAKMLLERMNINEIIITV